MSEIKTRKRRKYNIPSMVLTAVFLLMAGFFLFQVISEVRNTIELKGDLAEAQTILAKIKQENVELEEQKAKLEDPEYVKSYARGTYMLTKEGEQVFFLPSSLEENSGQ